ncbi:MAG: hypothetical protein KJ626_15350, partial [Verrucomicrobia bacterium]|nr:hypothetical protein [Verrucomicrobiota bacterium]
MKEGRIKLTSADVGTMRYEARDASLRPTGVTFPGGTTVECAYDALGRLMSINAQDPAHNPLLSETLIWSSSGQVSGRMTEHGDYSYTYNAIGNILSADNAMLPDESYTYDPSGRRRSSLTAPVWAYDTNGALVAYGDVSLSYDADGHLVSELSSSATNTYVYDAAGRLSRIEDAGGAAVAQYGYDADGRRIWKDVGGTRTYFHYANGQITGEYDADGHELRTYGYRPQTDDRATRIAPLFMKSGANYYWYLAGHDQSVRKIVDPSGQIVWSCAYDATGHHVVQVETVTNAIRFAGRYLDEETGLAYDGSFYNADIGGYIERERTDEILEQRVHTSHAPSTLDWGEGLVRSYQHPQPYQAPGLISCWAAGLPDPFAGLKKETPLIDIGGSGGRCQDGSGDSSEIDNGLVCARVTLEIQQELTLERQAFEAHMRINNGLEDAALEDINIEVLFKDGEGHTVVGTSDPTETDAAFFVRLDRKENIADIAGDGAIPASGAADIYWLIIPSAGAGGEDPRGQLYYVGSRLTYTIAGEENVTEVSPDYIYVKPMPLLSVDYFLPTDVYGDDAFTLEIEPPVPFPLGVRVRNSGYGIAKKLRIESAQPRITENEQGLLVGFEITGSEVNGAPATKSLTVDFGNINPDQAGTASWMMESTLTGEFTDFNAFYTHSDELGGELTTLMQAVDTHELVRRVLVDIPGRDKVLDFLARDVDVLRVYESDNVDYEVPDFADDATFELMASADGEFTYVLTVTETNQPFYVHVPLTDRDAAYMEIKSVTRSDGKKLNIANYWISRWRVQGGAPWNHDVNLFDVDGGGGYVVVLKRKAQPSNMAPVLQFIGPHVAYEGQQHGFVTAASDPNGDDVVMTVSNLPAGAVYTDNEDGTASFHWTPQSGDWGIY